MPRKVKNPAYKTEEYVKSREEAKNAEVGCVASHFLDSGSFSLWSLGKKWALENGKTEWDFYNTPDFWDYMKGYVRFIKKYQVAIDHYANVDVIGNGKLTYRNQRWLEARGLNPVPVVHFGDPERLKWLRHYLDRGYEYIGLGGLVGSLRTKPCQDWLDSAFTLVCDTPDKLPRAKLHGFGITQLDMLFRYPWYSVDSAAWTKRAAFGWIIVPKFRGGQFVFTKPPVIIKVSLDSPKDKRGRTFILNLNKKEKAGVEKWLEYIKIPLGRMEGEEVVEFGVCTRHWDRRIANLLYFEELMKHMPQYPQPFTSLSRQSRNNFGFVT